MRGPASSSERRRALGAWYTPDWLVDLALDLVLGGPPPAALRPTRFRVLDPACGDGRFLAAVGRRRPGAELVGIDVDPGAVDAARRALGPGGRVLLADALAHDWRGEQFDLVVGNPPFLNQLARATSRGGRSGLGGGAYADTAALFLALSVRLLRPGGRAVLVLPRSILATRDAAPIRAAVAGDAALDALWTAEHAVFDASVLTVVAAFTKGGRQQPVTRWVGTPPTAAAPSAVPAGGFAAAATWSSLVADLSGAPTDVGLRVTGTPLATVATSTADFRDQYYGLIGAVGDHDGHPLVTAGAIELGRCGWGERPVRFGGTTYARPSVDPASLSPAMAAWAQRRLVPKVLVATQTRVLEACVDLDGRWLPSVPVLSVAAATNAAVDPWALCAAICSPVASVWAAARFSGAGLSSSALKLSARQLLDLPLPSRPWDEAVGPLRDGDLARFGELMVGRYDGVRGDDARRVLDWWLPLAERARRAVRGASMPATRNTPT